MFFQPGVLEWLTGKERVTEFKVPEAKRFSNIFCATCGSRLPRQQQGSDMVMIPAGSLDDDAPIRLQASIFTDSRASWSCINEDLPVYPQYPPQ